MDGVLSRMFGARAGVVTDLLRHPALRRVVLAFLLFNVAEWATWIALLVWAYDLGGVATTSLVALAQLLPAAALAPWLASLSERVPRGRALALGYAVQATFFGACGVALAVGAHAAVVVVLAALAAVAVSSTRPVHNAVLPEVARTPAELTAANASTASVEALAILLGPLASSGLILLWGPGGVLVVMGAGCAVAALLGAGVNSRHVVTPRTTEDLARSSVGLALRDPTARLLTLLVGAESVLLGALDILLVVLALDVLGLSDAGPGLLNAMLGVGGLVGAGIAAAVVGGRRVVRAAAVGGAVDGLGIGLAGLVASPIGAAGLIGVSGCGKAVFDVGVRTLVQRLLPARLLTTVFGLQESMMMAGLGVGSLLAPGLVHLAGPRGALVVAGVALPVLVAGALPALRRLERRAVVPAEVLALLRGVPFLALLESGLLDRLAREATTTLVPAFRDAVTQGETGEHFHVIASGTAEVTVDGRTVRRLGPGDWFGELALLHHVPRTATVTAIEPLSLRTVDRDTFLAVVAGVGPAVDAVEGHARDHYR
jgi:MFS family permease